MVKRLRWTIALAIGAWVGGGALAEASCASSRIWVAAPPSVIGAVIPVTWGIEPACDVIETGLLVATDPASLAPVGQPIYGLLAAYQVAIPIAATGEYWIVAYARDEAGGLLESPPQSVVAAVPPLFPVGSPGSHGPEPTYTGTDEDFLQPVGNPHFATFGKDHSIKRTLSVNPFTGRSDENVERVIASFHRNEVLFEQKNELILLGQPVHFTDADILPSLDFADSLFISLGFPRAAHYTVSCLGFTTFGGAIRNSLCQPGGVILGYEQTDLTDSTGSISFTQSIRSSFTYFIPRPPPGKRIVSAILRAFVIVGRGDFGALRLSGKPPTTIEKAGGLCGPGFCNLWVTWDFTAEARALGAQGGELAVIPEAIPPEVQPRFSSANYTLFVNFDYPWRHRFGSLGDLRVTFEEACPKELKVTVNPDTLRPVLPGASSTIPVSIRSLPTQATVTALVKTCPAQPGSPPAPVEVTFAVQPRAHSTPEAGGHAHNTARPTGSLRDLGTGEVVNHCTVQTFDADGMGSCTVPYQAPEVSGVETIAAEELGFPKAQALVTVQVPNLIPMPESGIGAWRLTGGATGSHPENHHGTPETVSRIAAMATDYFAIHSESIGVNDISLVWGGLFDIGGNWAPPHHGHRIGRSVDIDRCAQSLVKQDDLDRIAERSYSGIRVEEKALAPPGCPGPPETPRIHYNFS